MNSLKTFKDACAYCTRQPKVKAQRRAGLSLRKKQVLKATALTITGINLQATSSGQNATLKPLARPIQGL